MLAGNLVQLQLRLDLVGLHGRRNILLVGEDEEARVFHFAVRDDAREFGAGFIDAVPVARVDDEDETLGAFDRGVSSGNAPVDGARQRCQGMNTPEK